MTFTDDEYQTLVYRFLQARAPNGVTEEETAHVLNELEDMRIGAVMLQMVFDDKIRPDWNGTEVVFGKPETE